MTPLLVLEEEFVPAHIGERAVDDCAIHQLDLHPAGVLSQPGKKIGFQSADLRKLMVIR
jgi:hypothetical protein